MENNVGRIQQHIPVLTYCLKGHGAIRETEGIRLSKPAIKENGIARRDSRFLYLVDTIPKFTISFEKENNKMLVVARAADVVRDVMGSDFLTGMCDRSYYQ